MDMCVRVRRGLVLAGLLLGVGIVGLGAGVAYAAPPAEAGVSASNIVVQGNRRVEADTVRSYFKAGPGEHLDAAKIDAALKALYASGLFDDVHITQSGGRIIVTVVESPVINRLAFEGNHRMKDEQLQEEIQSKARNSLSRARVQADTQRIVDVYHRNGRFDVTVTPQIIERPNNRVDLIFVVKEGEKTGVKSIDVRRQQVLFVVAAERGDQDRRIQLPELPADHRRLRPRPHGSRPRSDPPLLLEARLCRRAGGLGRCRIRSRQEGIQHHLHDRRRAAVPLRLGRRSIQCPCRRLRSRCSRSCACARATSTTARRSKRPSSR